MIQQILGASEVAENVDYEYNTTTGEAITSAMD